MANKAPSDETLMSYADGMLEGSERERIDELAAANSAIAARINLFRESARLAREVMDPFAKEPVPAPLLSAISKRISEANIPTSAQLILLKDRRAKASGQISAIRFYQRPGAVAACLAAIVGGTVGYFLAPAAISWFRGSELGQVSADLTSVLNTMPSGSEVQLGDSKIRVIASFNLADATLCRELEIDKVDHTTAILVTCREGNEWVNRLTVLGSATGDGYAPASSQATVDSYLTAVAAGEPLSTDREAIVLKLN